MVLQYFSATIFKALGFSSPTLTSLSVAGTNFIFTIVAFNLIDRLGRRRSLLYTIPFMVLGLLSCAVAFTFIRLPTTSNTSIPSPQQPQPNTSIPRATAIAILASLLLYIASYAVGLGPIPWTQSELFPLSVRSLGSSLSTATNWFCNTVVGLSFLPMMELLGAGWTFVVYAGVCAVGWGIVWGIYPETSGLGLEEVGSLLKEGWGVKDSVRRFEEGRRNRGTQEDDDS
jgi:MFS transporter, SP family, solute carrier family 2 (myo-inositol transporter), member 13